jgi:Gluconate 2-dehydrogenase subunit 3
MAVFYRSGSYPDGCMAEQIVPTDEWPGGCDAGVTNFIDIQLVGTYSRYQEIYRRG